MKTLAAFLVVIALLPSAASAIPVQWELDGTLYQGGTASGSFIYDADTASFSDILLTTSTDSPSGGLAFTEFGGQGYSGLIFLQSGTVDGTPTIGFELTNILLSLLTNDGGVLQVNTETWGGFAEFSCTPPDCSLGFGSNVSNWNMLGLNTLTGTPVGVPEPGTLGLLVLGAAWAMRARRRTSN